MVEMYISLWPNFLIVQDYPTDEILVVYDYDFKYGQNFYCAITEEAKEKILNVSLSLQKHHHCLHVKSILLIFYWFTVLCNNWGKFFAPEYQMKKFRWISCKIKFMRFSDRNYRSMIFFSSFDVTHGKHNLKWARFLDCYL